MSSPPWAQFPPGEGETSGVSVPSLGLEPGTPWIGGAPQSMGVHTLHPAVWIPVTQIPSVYFMIDLGLT
jgi:hypothetical protein